MKFLFTALFEAVEKEEVTKFFADIPKAVIGIQIDCKNHNLSDKPWELGDSVRLLMRAMRSLPINVKRVSFLNTSTHNSLAFYNMEHPINNILCSYDNLEFIERFFILELTVDDGRGNRRRLFNPNNASPQLKQHIKDVVDFTEFNLVSIGLPSEVSKLTIEYLTAGFGLFSKIKESNNACDMSETHTIKLES